MASSLLLSNFAFFFGKLSGDDYMMMEFLTGALVIVTLCIVWQAAFQNRTFIFEHRFKLYNELSKNMFEIYMLERHTTEKVLNIINASNYDAQKVQMVMFQFYTDPLSNLVKTINGIKYIYISQELKDLLMKELYGHAENICYYLGNQYFQSEKEISENEYTAAKEYLTNILVDGGKIKSLLDKELHLKNFCYYFDKIKHLVCS